MRLRVIRQGTPKTKLLLRVLNRLQRRLLSRNDKLEDIRRNTSLRVGARFPSFLQNKRRRIIIRSIIRRTRYRTLPRYKFQIFQILKVNGITTTNKRTIITMDGSVRLVKSLPLYRRNNGLRKLHNKRRVITLDNGGRNEKDLIVRLLRRIQRLRTRHLTQSTRRDMTRRRNHEASPTRNTRQNNGVPTNERTCRNSLLQISIRITYILVRMIRNLLHLNGNVNVSLLRQAILKSTMPRRGNVMTYIRRNRHCEVNFPI